MHQFRRRCPRPIESKVEVLGGLKLAADMDLPGENMRRQKTRSVPPDRSRRLSFGGPVKYEVQDLSTSKRRSIV